MTTEVSNLLVVGMGLGVVFFGLICLILVCHLISFFARMGAKPEAAKPAAAVAAAPAAEALAAVLAEHPPAIWEAVPHREARRRADHRGERCLPVTAAVCRIWEAFSADRAIWKNA